jgi:hypothetical protein
MEAQGLVVRYNCPAAGLSIQMNAPQFQEQQE